MAVEIFGFQLENYFLSTKPLVFLSVVRCKPPSSNPFQETCTYFHSSFSLTIWHKFYRIDSQELCIIFNCNAFMFIF